MCGQVIYKKQPKKYFTEKMLTSKSAQSTIAALLVNFAAECKIAT